MERGRDLMKKIFNLLFAFIFLFCLWGTSVLAADQSAEIDQLKQEVNKLLQRIEELEKKQTESEKKAVEVEKKTVDVEKKVAEVETKAAKVEKKSLKDRIELGGEFRARIMRENASTPEDFYGENQPNQDLKFRDETSFPFRIRLNAHAEVVPDALDFYLRLTMNKRWGAWDSSATDPFNRPNSFEASIGHDITLRVEQAYMTWKVPYVKGSTWYLGRLPGMDGAPSRQAGSLFPRPFIDSEIDGTLVKWDAPETGLDKANLPWTSTRLWGKQSEPGKAPVLKSYEAKVNDKTGFILGYLKYDERKMVDTDVIEDKSDADAFLAQGQLKVGKDTEIFLNGLIMDDWHMPVPSSLPTGLVISPSDIHTSYWLTGAYIDTQLFGFQLYGAYYFSHFDIREHTVRRPDTTTVNVEGQGFPGHLWFAGFNTGDLIHPKHQLTVEFADGSDAWINPFNYRGFRRKGTVLQPQNNYFYDPSPGSRNTVIGFYPFNASVLDIYYDYYAFKNVRFRLGYMDFNYSKHHHSEGTAFPILGSSKFEHDYWPYFELNLSF
jgi:ABC-type transporter MlaC component